MLTTILTKLRDENGNPYIEVNSDTITYSLDWDLSLRECENFENAALHHARFEECKEDIFLIELPYNSDNKIQYCFGDMSKIKAINNSESED